MLHNFNADGFDSLYPRYRGGRPPRFTLAQRRQIKQLALSRPQDHDLPFSTWSLHKLADFLVAEGVVEDISHEGLREVLREQGRVLSTPEDLEAITRSCLPRQSRPGVAPVRPYGRHRGRRARRPRRRAVHRRVRPLEPPTPPRSGSGPLAAAANCSRADDDGRPTESLHGVRHLLAAYDLNRDRLYGHVKPRKRRGEFLVFLRYVRSLYPHGVRLGIVLDNASAHLTTKKDARVGDWAAGPTTSS